MLLALCFHHWYRLDRLPLPHQLSRGGLESRAPPTNFLCKLFQLYKIFYGLIGRGASILELQIEFHAQSVFAY